METSPQRIELHVNDASHLLLAEPRRTLLDTLRDDLHLTGTKKVCNMGDCGACTVLVDGRPMYSCLVLAITCDGRQITTIEGLAHDGELDPVQQAFIEADAFQCGFCTSGQIMSLRALLNETTNPSDEEIQRAVTGNLCRCGAYVNILKAGRIAVDLETKRRGQSNGRTKAR
ncbi:MAG TPA: (2Fe-2S)-binding protein [Thermomicrobiales bacterium]|nr:(2Fe-2S)-binding protein [Thermomicrobiales bacterium]